MLYNKFPFKPKEGKDPVFGYFEALRDENNIPEFPSIEYPEKYIDLMKSMLNRDPKKRPTAT